MANFTGTSGKDNYVGTTNNDTFDMSQGGNDTIFGDDGSDLVEYGAEMTNRDKFDGGDGTDEANLNGDYSAGLTLGNNSFTGVERMSFEAGHSYDITLKDVNTSGAFTVFGNSLAAGSNITFSAGKDTDTAFVIFMGGGDDVIHGGDFSNTFNLQVGGSDTAYGGDGADIFSLFDHFDSTDRLRGGLGTDTVGLFGDYSAGMLLTHSMIRDIESIQLSGAFDYNFSSEDALIAAGGSLTISTTPLDSAHTASFDGSAETDGRFNFDDGAAVEGFIGGDGDDTFGLSEGGDDFGDGGDGDDDFNMGGGLSPGDVLDGHHGDDTLTLGGDYSGGIALLATTIHSIEEIFFVVTHSYDVTMDDANVAAGDTLLVDGSFLNATDTLIFDGSTETDGAFDAEGGDAADTIIGGSLADTLAGGDGDDILNGRQGDDVLNGGAGADELNGALDSDIFVYAAVSQSTGAAHDLLGTFSTVVDLIDLPFTVSGVDAKITAGTLNSASFDSDLVTAVNGTNLAVGEAVIFQPNAGSLSGHKYLIVDANGSAGYQTAADYVIEIDTGFALNSLSTTNFI